MSDEQYHIRRDEWQEVRETVKRIERAVDKFLEREKASDAAISRAQMTADRANERIDTLALTVAEIERASAQNSGNWSDIKFLGLKVTGGVLTIAIIAIASFFMGAA